MTFFDDPFGADDADEELEFEEYGAPGRARSGGSATRSLPAWALGAGAVLILAVVVVGGYLLLAQTRTTPVDTTRAFYARLAVKDFTGATEYVDPDSVVAIGALDNATLLEEMIPAGDLLGEFESVVQLDWELVDVDFEMVEQNGDEARVRVRGRVRVLESGTNLGVTLPFQLTHRLVRIERKWYIRLI